MFVQRIPVAFVISVLAMKIQHSRSDSTPFCGCPNRVKVLKMSLPKTRVWQKTGFNKNTRHVIEGAHRIASPSLHSSECEHALPCGSPFGAQTLICHRSNPCQGTAAKASQRTWCNDSGTQASPVMVLCVAVGLSV